MERTERAERPDEKVEFQTIKSEELTFGKNNFLEVARKKAITERGVNEFVSISRGFVTTTGERRFKTSVSMPLDAVEKAVEALKKVKTD